MKHGMRRPAFVLALLLQTVAVSTLVTVAATPESATAATPTAYVANLYNNTVTSVDTGTNTVGSTTSTGSGPAEIAITPTFG
jgi:YVTN family beta-propeller protein